MKNHKIIKSVGYIIAWLFVISFSTWFGSYVPSQIFSQATLENIWSWIIGVPPIILGISTTILITCYTTTALAEIWKKL